MATDQEIVAWVKSGSVELIDKAIAFLYGLPELNRRIRTRCRKMLEERQMLHPDQPFYRADAEEDALFWIFERAFSRETLPLTVLGRQAHGGFDPCKGRLVTWLVQAAHFQFRNWLRKVGDEQTPRGWQSSADDANPDPADERGTLGEELQQESRLNAKLTRLREMFAEKLAPVQRACMLAKYVSDSYFNVLTDDDFRCLDEVRRRQDSKAKAARGDVDSNRDEIRTAMKLLWEKVAARTAGAARNFASGDPTPLVGSRKREAKVELLFAKLQQQSSRLDRHRKGLINAGRSPTEVEALERQSQGLTLGELQLKHANSSKDERFFTESAQRVHRLRTQLEAARLELESLPEHPLPLPKEIAAFLNLTTASVSPALSRAEKVMGGHFSQKESEDDARAS